MSLLVDSPDYASGYDREPDEDARLFPTVSLVELARTGVPAPVRLCDGMLYRGSLHSLSGPPDGGKSTVLYAWSLDLLKDGHAVVLLDEESGREQVVEKFVALGAQPDDFERLAYVEFAGRRWDDADRAGLAALLKAHRPALVGYDSSAALLSMAGRDENHNGDVTAFYKLLLEASRTHDVAGVVLDHMPKDAKSGGRYARGAGAKLATVDVAYMLDVVKPFSRAASGLLTLTASKDRRGFLHRDHDVRVLVDDGRMTLAFERTEAPDGGELAGLAPAAVKVLSALRGHRDAAAAAGQPVTGIDSRTIGDLVAARHGHGLRRETISRGCADLVERGLADEAQPASNGPKYWTAT